MNILFNLALAVLVIICLAIIKKQRDNINRKDKRIKKHDETYLSKSGGLIEFGNYNLKSFDGGKNWYVIEYTNTDTNDWGVKIIGAVEEVHPGLMRALKSWDTLSQRAKNNGPLDLTDQNDQLILKNCGFIVTKT